MLKAAQARDEAIRLADAGDYDAALDRLAEPQVALRAAGLTAEADELEQAARLVTRELYDPVSRKRLHYRSQGAKRGRPYDGTR